MTAMTLVLLAADKEPTGEASKSGPWGIAIILLLCLASYFLFKSMSKHMRKVREQYPTDRNAYRRTGATVRPGRRPPGPAPDDARAPQAGRDAPRRADPPSDAGSPGS